MPIQLSASISVTSSGPTVVETFVVHLPEEIVVEASRAEACGALVLVYCRAADQARTLSDRLLSAGIGSAIIDGTTSAFDVRQALEAFSFADFTVLLATDDVPVAWRAPDQCGTILHADLPAIPGTRQFFATLRARRERTRTADVSHVA